LGRSGVHGRGILCGGLQARPADAKPDDVKATPAASEAQWTLADGSAHVHRFGAAWTHDGWHLDKPLHKEIDFVLLRRAPTELSAVQCGVRLSASCCNAMHRIASRCVALVHDV
jgi:hypothetical protein